MVVVDMSMSTDVAIISTEAEILLQEICVLFDTNPGEVFGEDEFGSDFEKFVWDLSVSNSQISQYVRDIIYKYIYLALKFEISIDTQIIHGTKGDIILITINIIQKDNGDTYVGTYKIS